MNKLNMLIIEDEENICNFIKTALRPQGYKIMTASTVADGLSIANSGACNLILLDLGLPDADALDVIRQFAPGPAFRLSSSLPAPVNAKR